MKRIKPKVYTVSALLLMFFVIFNVNAVHKIRYAPLATDAFLLSVKNFKQTSNSKLEFDAYLQDTNPTLPFELASMQFGFLINSAIYAGGTLTVTIDNTNSGLNAIQKITASPNAATKTGSQTVIKLASGIVTAGQGTIISTAVPGTLITHFIITSSVPFPSNITPDLIFTSSTSTTPLYATRVAEFINSLSTQLDVNIGTANAIVNGNPVLNPAPTAYAVSGSGSYCQNGAGLPVGLSGSDLGINYQLYNGASTVGTAIAGTGSAINFGNQTAGTYTVTATNATTSITASMTGSAVITANPPVTPDVSIEASSNPAATGASVTFTPTPVNGGLNPAYEWFINNVSVGTGETYSYVPTDGDQIYAKMTSNDTSPCLTGNPATSNTITMSVSPGTGFSNEKALRINTYSTNKAIYIDCPIKIKQLSVFNMLGSVIAMEENVTGLRKINLNSFANECYVVKVVTDNNVTTQKILLK